ncbi:hypothetical protein L6164_025979 [Bauhinia variegata]|uniref:Uncharacterized protein n=1 Tax=Bauhinia variegata TaxID=167791 RepID=A0ACB9M3R7_BAUVA|nr:hypothetical protein L6164_025979 [Bauhinia variegata]
MSHILAPFQLLELNVISAQDLAPAARSMRTYAVAWVHPDRKLSTRIDTHGHNNPTWNDKFVFRVDDEFLYSDTSAIMIEIYALHWFRDIHVGTVRVLVGNLIPPPTKPFTNTHPPLGMRFVALQVKRASGRPQGILNIGVAVLDSSMRSMPLYTHNPSAVGYRHLMGEKDAFSNHNHLSPSTRVSKPELRRTKSDTSSMIVSEVTARRHHVVGKTGKASSVITLSEASYRNPRGDRSVVGSSVNGSEVSKKKKTGSVLSDSLLSWKGKKKKKSNKVSGANFLKEQMEKGKIGKPSPVVNTAERVKSPYRGNGNENKINNQHPMPSESLISTSDETATTTTTNDTAGEKQGSFPINNNMYEVKPSPMPQFRNSPSKPFRNSPSQQYRNSPSHQFRNSPSQQFRNSPSHQFRNSPSQQFQNSPSHQFRNSPKPNLAQGLAAGSRRATPRATPLHPKTLAKLSGEYGTPRRSNLGAAPVITESELGPSPSEVAAAMAKVPKIEEENSTVGGWSCDESVEGLQSKLERWRTELPPVYDQGELSSLQTSSKATQNRRHSTDGGNGLFSCFSNICGVQCTIVCGGGDERKKGGGRGSSSAENLSFV